MAERSIVAELLVELGVDARDAERGAKKVKKALDGVERSATKGAKAIEKNQKAIDRLAKSSAIAGKVAKGLAVAMAVTAGVVVGLGKAVIGTGMSFESLKVQLKTATGSAEGAEKAFAFVREFAKNTPFQVEEITRAFVKMTNLGLDPSERALTSYGDTASAMGKSLDQMVEAVADAAVGEFERLKEFGIKARKQGDEISFTFRGVKTTIGNNSKEIEGFLIGLGEQNFAGGMAEQMGTLSGIVSNAKDAFAEFLLAVAELGPLEEFKGLISDLRDATGDKDGLAKSLAKTLVSAIRALRRALKGDLIGTLKTVAKTLQFVVENFDKLVFLFGAAKTIQAFNAVAVGFRSMGIAAAGALGPIGLIAAAVIAIIPIAMDAGKALDGVLSKQRAFNDGRSKVRGQGGVGDVQAAGRGRELEKAQRAVRDAETKLAGFTGPAILGGKDRVAAEQRLRAARARERAIFRESKQSQAGKAAQAKQAAERGAKLDAAEAEEFGGFDADVAAIAEQLGITEEKNTPRQQAQLEKAVLALAEGKSRSEAAGAAGLNKKRGRGRGGGRKKTEPKTVTSPTTVSEFFTAAALGELGPIAARTPSTKDIEPTVAVDITNNNFSFSDTFNIKGSGDALSTGKAVILEIKAEFDRRLASAGQSMAGNVVR